MCCVREILKKCLVLPISILLQYLHSPRVDWFDICSPTQSTVMFRQLKLGLEGSCLPSSRPEVLIKQENNARRQRPAHETTNQSSLLKTASLSPWPSTAEPNKVRVTQAPASITRNSVARTNSGVHLSSRHRSKGQMSGHSQPVQI